MSPDDPYKWESVDGLADATIAIDENGDFTISSERCSWQIEYDREGHRRQDHVLTLDVESSSLSQSGDCGSCET